MKKQHFNIVLIVLSVIFVGLQYVYSQIKLKTGVYNQHVRNAEYIIIVLLVLTTLLYTRKDKDLFKKLLVIYVFLAILFIAFLLRGVI